MSDTTIRPCHCGHAYQDARYGKGNRVHNYGPKKPCWRCTVCRNEKVAEQRKAEPR